MGHIAFFVTLLTPTDDPNTFELVARSLKMKARGNQKNNEANQIKSSPYDTENHQPIVQNQSVSILAQVLSLAFSFLCLTLRFALSSFPMVVADVVSLQRLAHAFLDGLLLLASGKTAQPSPTPPSRSSRRRMRRLATMRRLFCANLGDSSPAQVDASASPSMASGCVVASDATPSPVPAVGSVLQTSHVEALTDDDLAACLSDLHDFSRSALCRSQKRRFEIDFKLLQDDLQAGIQQLNAIVSQMRLCESGTDNGPPPVAQPTAVTQDPSPEPTPEVDGSLRPFQPFDIPLGQPSSGWGPPFQDAAPQHRGHECKQQ